MSRNGISITGVEDSEHTSVNGRHVHLLLVRHGKSLRYGTRTNKAIEYKLVTRRVSNQVSETLKYVHLNGKHQGHIMQVGRHRCGTTSWASQGSMGMSVG